MVGIPRRWTRIGARSVARRGQRSTPSQKSSARKSKVTGRGGGHGKPSLSKGRGGTPGQAAGVSAPPGFFGAFPPCDQRALWKSGISLWKAQYDAFVAPLTLAPYSKNRIRGLHGGSYGPDHALARVDAQPGNVGRDCPCDGHVPRMRTSLGVKVERADRPGRSCFRLWGVER